MYLLHKLKGKFKKTKKQSLSFKGEIDKALLSTLLPPSPIIVEAGAHIGRDTIELAQLWPNGHVHAFEPVKSIYEQLVVNSKSYSNISCYQLALSEKDGIEKIFISSGSSDGSSSLLKPKEHLKFHPGVMFHNYEYVPTITIDSWANAMGISTIDFLWLDLQGMELSVLRASEKILEKVKVIYSEVNLIPLYDNAPLYPELKAWLHKKGFLVHSEFIPWQDAGNVLFVRETPIVQ